jgi:DNA-binding LytR/AlgR family response regulator
MKVIILEDEMPAAEFLKRILLEISSDIEVVNIVHSLREAQNLFEMEPEVDLVFMDIELGDGLSIELLREGKINCPVIFITAYDEYWQEAFEYNGIDYLLKPLRQERLEAALRKFKELKGYFAARMKDLLTAHGTEQRFKERFLVKRGINYLSIKTSDIAFFFASQKLSFLVDTGGSKFVLDNSLSEIKGLLDPALFFRINRKYLVNIKAIKKIKALPKSKLQVEITPHVNEELIISAENRAEFKNWMDR